MTIRRQLTLSYLGILLLLGCNLLIYLWTDAKREAAFEDLRRAISRQTLIGSIQQQLGDYQKQVTLLSQITGEGGLSAPSPEETEQFNSHLDSIGQEIQQVAALTGTRRQSQHRVVPTSFRRTEHVLAIVLSKPGPGTRASRRWSCMSSRSPTP